jgi:hypothetical protein
MLANRYAVVTSTIALVIAIGGGTAYAADLVTSRDILDGGVHRADLHADAVTSAKVADGSLTGRDLRAGSLPAGPAGATGPAGPAGPAGSAGTAGPGPTYAYVDRVVSIPFNPIRPVVLHELACPVGSHILAGYLVSITDPTAFSGEIGLPKEADGISVWVVGLRNDGIATGSATFRLICAT